MPPLPHATAPAPRAAGPALPREGPERALVLALRFVAAAAETGDAACYEAAFSEAEAAFGPRDGALVVARAAALLRAARREGVAPVFLLPACRSLSPGEADLVAALRALRSGRPVAAGDRLPRAMRLALADLARTDLAHTDFAHTDFAHTDLAAPVQHRSLGRFETTDWTCSGLAATQFPAVLS